MLKISSNQTQNVSLAFLALIITFSYAYSASYLSIKKSYWMDEVLALIVATQPNMELIIKSIWEGTDFSPPSFHILIFALRKFIPDDYHFARGISIVAGFLTGLVIFKILRQRYSTPASLLAFSITLASPLFDYAIQVRQYALLTLLLALSLAFWDNRAKKETSWNLISVGLFFCLALSISLHFYGVITLIVIFISESIFFCMTRRMRIDVWMTMSLSLIANLYLLPLAIHLAHINAQDHVGSSFYGYPSFDKLIEAIYYLIFVGSPFQFIIYVGIIIALLSYYLPNLGMRSKKQKVSAQKGQIDLNISIMLISLLSIPFIVFSIGHFVTGTFVSRYALGSVLFLPMFTGTVFHHLQIKIKYIFIVILFVIMSLFIRTLIPVSDAVLFSKNKIQESKELTTFFVGDGRFFIELIGAIGQDNHERIKYLASPTNLRNPDPTNENAVKRLSRIDPRFDYVEFNDPILMATPFFFLRVKRQAIDLAFLELHRKHQYKFLIFENEQIQIYRFLK